MDAGSHSKECADAVSGVCHCDCHGSMHGIAHMRGHRSHGPGVTVARRSHGGYQVTREDGLPPGGGTTEERTAHRAARVQVASAGPEQHRTAPDTTPEYSRPAQRLVDFADAMRRHRERGNSPFGQRVDTLAEFNRVSATPREHFDALTPAHRAEVEQGLEQLRQMNANSPDAHNRIADTIRRFGGPDHPAAVAPPPRHVQEVLDVVDGRRRGTALPLSMAYADISRRAFEQHFSPAQRARAATQLREILGNMSRDARDRPGAERALADLESIDRPAAVQVRASRPATPPATRTRGRARRS